MDYSQTKKEAKIVKDFETKYQASKNYFEDWHEEFNDYEDMYWSYIDSNKFPWKSKVFIPESFEKIESLSAHLSASEPKGSFMPRDINDGLDFFAARVMDELYRYQWSLPEQDMHLKLTRTLKQMALFGAAFVTLKWRYETKKVTKEDGTEENEVIFDAPYMQELYIYDCYPDPSATSIQDMQWFMHDEYTTINTLKSQNRRLKGVSIYKNLDKLEELYEKSKDASEYNKRQRVDKITSTSESSNVKGRIRVRRLYTRTRWQTVAVDFNLVIEDRPCPYDHGDLPVHMVVDHPYPNQLFGVGELQPIKSLQQAINRFTNQRFDNVQYMMNPVVKVRNGSKFAHTWVWEPGRKWVVENPGDIEQFQLADVTAGAFQQSYNVLKDAIERSLGTLDVLTRTETAESRTATEIRAIQGEQNARRRAKERNVDVFITRLLNQWAQLNQQYMITNKLIRIVGREAINLIQALPQLRAEEGVEIEGMPAPYETVFIDGVPVPRLQLSPDGSAGFLAVTPDDIRGSFDFVVESGSTTNTDTKLEMDKLQQAIDMLNVYGPTLMQNGVQVNMQPLLERMLLLLGVKDIDKVFQQAPVMDPQQPMQPEQALL